MTQNAAGSSRQHSARIARTGLYTTFHLCKPCRIISRRGDACARPFEAAARSAPWTDVESGRHIERQSCENTSPPTTAIPSGCRISDPVPVPSASGNVAKMAAMVVIMIGRNRMIDASTIASAGGKQLLALQLQREIDHHDPVLLHQSPPAE